MQLKRFAKANGSRDADLQMLASVDDLLLSDDLEDGDFFAFVGYPWRKPKRYAGKQESDQTTYTGHAIPREKYEKLGCKHNFHIVIRMR